MLLPMRAGHTLDEYRQAGFSDFTEFLPEHVSELLGDSPISDAVLFPEAITEDGHHFLFQGCDQGGLVFMPKDPLMSPELYQHTLIFLELQSRIFAFETSLKYLFQGALHFDMPRRMYKRNTRHNKRVPIEGSVVLGRKNGTTATARIYDFSPTGISFLTEEPDFKPGESVFASFDVPGCGTCETIATVVRVENRPSVRGFRSLVAVKMALTQAQRSKAEQLYLCKKGEELQKRSGNARTPHPGTFHLKD